MRGERHNQHQNPEITALSCNLKRDRAAVCFPPDGVFMLGNEEYSFGGNNFLEVRTVKQITSNEKITLHHLEILTRLKDY